MSEKKEQVRDNVCLGNISLKGEKGSRFVRDGLYTDEEVRRVPKNKKHKFTKFDVTPPGFDKGTESELRELIQRQQIKIQHLEDALAERESGKKDPFEEEPEGKEKAEPEGKAITSKTGGQNPVEKL